MLALCAISVTKSATFIRRRRDLFQPQPERLAGLGYGANRVRAREEIFAYSVTPILNEPELLQRPQDLQRHPLSYSAARFGTVRDSVAQLVRQNRSPCLARRPGENFSLR